MQLFREIPFIDWNDTDPIIDVGIPFSGGAAENIYGSIELHGLINRKLRK